MRPPFGHFRVECRKGDPAPVRRPSQACYRGTSARQDAGIAFARVNDMDLRVAVMVSEEAELVTVRRPARGGATRHETASRSAAANVHQPDRSNEGVGRPVSFQDLIGYGLAVW